MKGHTTLYSYADSWQNEVHSKTLNRTIKRTYLFKAILLFFALPVDILYLIIILLSKRRYDIFFATEKWPNLAETVSKNSSTAKISSPAFFINNFRSKVEYIPASVFYVLTATGLFLPTALRQRWSNIAVYLLGKILVRLASDVATMVVHSDALPFGRGLIMAANGIGIKSVCIQHGSFREYNIIGEQEGFLCAHNIVRSVEDGKIIKRSNSETSIHILTEFFKIRLRKNLEKSTEFTVLLLGEGYHIVDNYFNDQYLQYLDMIQDQLLTQGIDVLFRPHPSEKNFKWNKRFCGISKAPLDVCLSTVDAVIGYSSTLLQESAEAGISAFYVDPLGNGHEITGRNGATIHKFVNAEQVISHINKKKKLGEKSAPDINESESYRNVIDVFNK